MAATPTIIVSYAGREERLEIGVKPSVELGDDEVEKAAEELWNKLRQVFQLTVDSRLTLHETETETGRILSKETFRDPSHIPIFPKYWYLTVDNGYNTASLANLNFQSLSGEDPYSTMDCSDLSELLLMERYSPLRPDQNQDTRLDQYDDEDDDLSKYDMYPSLMELSMGQSPSLDGSREDLMTMSLTCDKEGLFGITLRHFTVIANVPHSEHSSSESGSRNGSRSGSRCSTHSSSDSYDVLRMSTLFVHSVSPGGPAEVGGLQNGDIVYSINGNSISGSTTEEIIGYIEESGSNVVFWVSPERHDDLLFLYPQYVQGEPGEYSRDGSEKIIVTDIIVKTNQVVSPKENVRSTEHRRLYRPVSADERLLHRITSGLDSYLIEDNYPPVLNTTSSREDSSTNSLSSGVEGYNSSNDDLLISGALEDIPIEHSPLQHRRHFVRNNHPSLSNHFDQPGRSVSQDWLSQDVRLSNGTGPEWFPGAADDPREFTFSLSMNATSKHDPSSSMSQSGDHSYSGQPNSNSGPNKLARKFKQTIKTLKESATGHRKLVKTSSLGLPQTRSTSALDRMKIKNSSPSSLSPQTQQRSRSTDLGRIKLKRESLEALTKVSSAENLAVSSNNTNYLQKQHSNEKTYNIANNRVPTIAVTRLSIDHQPVVHQSVKSEETASSSQYEQYEELSQTLGSTQQLSQEHGRNLSCESNGSGQTSLKSRAAGKSYRSQRERLHQTRSNPRSSTSDDKEGFSTSLIVAPSSSPNFNNITRRTSRDSPSNESLSFTRIGSSRHTYRQNRPAKNSYNSKPDDLTSPIDSSVHLLSSQEHYYSTGNNSTFDNSYSRTRVPSTNEAHQGGKPLVRSHSMNEGSDNSDINSKHQSFTTSIDPSHLQQHQQLPYRPRSSGHIDKQAFTKSLLVQASPPVYNSSMYNSREEIRRDRMKEELLKDKRKDELSKNQLGKFNSIFHGPINKKHERSQGGRKSSERSWRAIYAAIQGHHMVFYSTVQDALTCHPLSSDPALDLHHCMVTVLPRKKHVFRLSFADASECLIQAENEESMMRWMRIIHNLNRMRRMGPLPPHLQNRGSTQDDTIKKEQSPLKRIYTPQPPNKRSREKDETSRKVLLDKLKRTIRNRSGTKDVIDGNDEVPYYNTFGLPLEECPASYESKNVPLVMMICVKEIETNWLDTEGLYRVAGPIGQVKTLASELNRGRYDLLQGHNDPHVITAILKKFLKELPNPLIPPDKYDFFISSARDPDPESRTIKLKELVRELPQMHHHTLAFLMRHLNRVKAHSNINKMAQRNLCLVFGPTVVRKPNNEENSSLVTDMNFTYIIIETLMNNVDDFFDPFHTLIVNHTDEDDLSPPEKLMLNGPLKRGDSDPSCSSKKFLSYTSRRSFDETHAKSLLSINSQGTGDVPFSFSLGNEFSFSQEFREGKRHKRHRLARSRKLLTSHEEEPQKDLSSPVNPNPPSTSPPLTSPMSPFGINSRPKVHDPPSRKLSYNTAIQDGQIALSGGNVVVDSDLLEEPFSHQGLSHYNGRHYQMPHHQPPRFQMRSYHQQSGMTNPQDGQKRRWSSTGPFTEIVGPSASNNWTNNSWTDTRLKATSVSSSLHRGPESRL